MYNITPATPLVLPTAPFHTLQLHHQNISTLDSQILGALNDRKLCRGHLEDIGEQINSFKFLIHGSQFTNAIQYLSYSVSKVPDGGHPYNWLYVQSNNSKDNEFVAQVLPQKVQILTYQFHSLFSFLKWKKQPCCRMQTFLLGLSFLKKETL